MKVHKYTLYVFDFEDYGVEEYKILIDYTIDRANAIFHEGTAEIGEWDDDHELNQTDDQMTFEKYFK